jgi:hypothetical protein
MSISTTAVRIFIFLFFFFKKTAGIVSDFGGSMSDDLLVRSPQTSDRRRIYKLGKICLLLVSLFQKASLSLSHYLY